MDNTGVSTEETISEEIPPLYALYDDKHDVDKLRRIAQALEHDGNVTIRTKDVRIVKVTAIIYDGNGWYATSGMGTYDQHGLRWYETGTVIRADDITALQPETQK